MSLRTASQPASTRRVATDPRFSRRRRTVERTRRRKAQVAIAVILALAAAGWAAFASPLLRVREVRLVGARHTTPEEVTDAAALGTSDNLLLVSTDAIAKRVEALPWVASADVNRILPGTVRVRVTERRPALVLSLGAARWTIDDRGRVLEPGRAEKGLPVLAGARVAKVEPGLRLITEEVGAALLAWRSMPRALRRELAGIFVGSVERITLSLRSGIQVRYGAAERLGAKNKVLRALLDQLHESGETPAYIDVRVPTRPAIGAPGVQATPNAESTPAA